MAEAGSWECVKRHGLLSTTALLDLFEVSGDERDAIEAARRPESVPIHHPDHGTAWIRDNKPINETVLERTLTGMSEPDWYRTLNGRVFFWLSQRRLKKLRNAGAYAEREHDILTIDTQVARRCVRWRDRTLPPQQRRRAPGRRLSSRRRELPADRKLPVA